jgi:hypothetical protein
MWLFTQHGFFSVVRDVEINTRYAIRARSRADLVALRLAYLRDTHSIVATPARDYPWRIYVSKKEWVDLATKAAKDVDYTNFKGQVYRTQGKERAHLYHDVWATMLALSKQGERDVD